MSTSRDARSLPAALRPDATSLHAGRRRADLEALAGGEVVDVLVVGGGATGAGIAFDAAARGLSVALLERRDLAHGTSRWSSKLVHGGLRYLARGDVGLAWESAAERGILMSAVAPHLVRRLPMLLPLQPHTPPARAALAGAGFLLGNALRVAARTSPAVLPGPRRIGARQALALAPGLAPEGLRGGLVAWDGQLVDDARLVLGLARTAAALGARVVTRCEVTELDGTGATARDGLTGATLTVRARHVVSATGVWADRLSDGIDLRPSKGAHLVLRAEAVGHPRAAITVPVPDTLNRFVFLLPQASGLVLLGLTDDEAPGADLDDPSVGPDEVRFLLETANRALDRPLTTADVVGRFAGYRPLLAGEGGASADLSRRHDVRTGLDGVVSVVGGKLTTYRRMAAEAVDAVVAAGAPARTGCSTARLPLVGAAPRAVLRGLGVPRRLAWTYGTEALRLRDLAGERPDLDEPVASGLPHLRAELAFAVAHEGALTVADLLDRRTRIGLVPADRARAEPAAREALEEAGLG